MIRLLIPVLGLAICTLSSAAPARGPLTVCLGNPRYFQDDKGNPVYLVGSHTWSNLQDMGHTDPPLPFDHAAYLKWMRGYGHNFIRLWRFEFAYTPNVHPWGEKPFWVSPQPWPRTGPGLAADGKPKFDLSRFDAEFFRRLRTMVGEGGREGFYVSVMLFCGWGATMDSSGWASHPFNAANNINDINGDPDGDGVGTETHTLALPAVLAIQEAYVRRAIATVGDLDNLLWEISNETPRSSTEWQYHLINLIKAEEAGREKQHPVGMTYQYADLPLVSGTNQLLFDSPADWVSPNAKGGFRDQPPASDGAKVILNDTDHLWGIGGNEPWVWKCACAGLNPVFMDPYDGLVLGKPFDPQWEPIRKSLGYSREYVGRLDLKKALPRPELVSSGWCLAVQGKQYLAYVQQGPGLELDLSAALGTLSGEWFNSLTAERIPLSVEGGTKRALTSPFGESGVVLWLESAESPE